MKGQLIIPDSSGHTTIEWDTEVKDGPLDPREAKVKFDEMLASGMLAVGTTEAGANVAIRKFDPETYPRIAIIAAAVGG